MVSATLAGFLAAAISAMFNGSFAAAFKVDRVARVSLSPMLFMLYVSMGVTLSSALFVVLLPLNPTIAHTGGAGVALTFTPLGLAAGALFCTATSLSFIAIDKVGVALAQGIWSGCAILVSFLWGVSGFGEEVEDWPLCALGLALLFFGVLGIAFCERLAEVCTGTADGQPDHHHHHHHYATRNVVHSFKENDDVEAAQAEEKKEEGEEEYGASYVRLQKEDGDDDEEPEAAAPRSSGDFLVGCASAALVGLFGGSILVPMHYVPDSAAGVAFVPSFGVGTFVASPILVALFLTMQQQQQQQRWCLPPLHLQEALPAGLFSGFLWNVSNVCSIYAIPRIGYSLACPLLQCALLFGALWGVFVFGEIKGGRAIAVLFFSGLVLLSGAVCLGLAATG